MSGEPTSVILNLSTLPKTWLIDLDGTVFRHNGHLAGADDLLPGARELWAQIEADDVVIVMSARGEEHREASLRALAAAGLRVDQALFDLPTGERVLINDRKPSGLPTAFAVNPPRDAGPVGLIVRRDPSL